MKNSLILFCLPIILVSGCLNNSNNICKEAEEMTMDLIYHLKQDGIVAEDEFIVNSFFIKPFDGMESEITEYLGDDYTMAYDCFSFGADSNDGRDSYLLLTSLYKNPSNSDYCLGLVSMCKGDCGHIVLIKCARSNESWIDIKAEMLGLM